METRKIFCTMILFTIMGICLVSSVFGTNRILIEKGEEVSEEIMLNGNKEVNGIIIVEGGSVNFSIVDPAKQILLSLNSIISHDFNFRTDIDGVYTLCFTNLNDTGSIEVDLEYTEKYPSEQLDWTSEYDRGGVWSALFSLILTAVLFCISYYKKNQGRPDKTQQANLNLQDWMKKNTMTAVFLAILFVAIWVGLRAFLVYLRNYLFIEGYSYNQYEILDLIAYALTINLAFTLLNKIPEKIALYEIVNTAIQSVLIGIIVLLPKSGNNETIWLLGGGINFAILVIATGILLLCLVIASKVLKNKTRIDCYT